ncbi:MAG: phosphate ABC transporter substrate-binding protein PstS [Longimicrobiaceae bacterium]
MKLIRMTPPLLALSLASAGCDGQDGTPGEMAGAGGRVTLIGAGATFPYPLYARWFDSYAREHGVRVNYQSIGSGGGIRQMLEGTVDFGASDAPLNREERARAPELLQIPTVLGADVITYNLAGATAPLRLTGGVIAAIFLGEITRWDDPRLRELNPRMNLPDRAIIPVHRSDGSGTTYIFTDYLASVSPDWRERVGRGKSVGWPTGLGGRGNEGVTGQIKQTPGAIGYVEQIYAVQNELPMAHVQNRSGSFIEPSLEATSAAAAGIGERVEGGDYGVSIVDPEGTDAYPIASLTYLLVDSQMEDCTTARALAAVIEWALTEGDEQALELRYGPLPGDLEQRVLNTMRSELTCGPNREPVMEPGAAAGAGKDAGTGY